MAGSQMSAKKRGGDGKAGSPKQSGSSMSGSKSTTFTGPLKPGGKSTSYTGGMRKK